jgi:trk system potassium uptake protein TrkH
MNHIVVPAGTVAQRFFTAVVRLMNGVAVCGLLMLALDPSLGEYWLYRTLTHAAVFPVYAIFLLHLSLAVVVARDFMGFVRHHSLDLLFFVPLFTFTVGGVHPAHVLLVRQFLFYFNLYLEKNTIAHLATRISERPARLIALSFLGVILIGTFLLVLPLAVSAKAKPSFLAALFTSTSAVCVTGLSIVDPGTYFSLFGQVVVLVLIQVGGLGIMTLSSMVALLIGKHMAITQRAVMQNVLDQSDVTGLFQNLKAIMFWTFGIELLGAVILAFRFNMIRGDGFVTSLYLGVFHSVSAFCNAGFALFPDSLMSFSEDPIICGVVMILIVTGGLGFSVLGNLAGYAIGRHRGPYDIHSVLAGVTSLGLILVGAVGILAMEGNSPTMAHLSGMEKWLAAFFQSVTTRTAGFNTIDTGALQPGTLFFMIILMFIGASPASTGGGIKTTTFATMWLALHAQMQECPETVVMGRTIPRDTVLRAFLITAISAVLVALCMLCFLLIEDKPFLPLLFEVVSAFATVGLSCNVTAQLSSLSHVLLIVLMFIGRIGPLTLALSVRKYQASGNVQYPDTKILVG